MSFRTDYIERWRGFVPQTGLEFWHACVPGEFSGAVVPDYSGNDREISTANAGEPPVDPLPQANVLGSAPGVYFDGTKTPLVSNNSTIGIYHVFILAKYDGASFTGFEGLLSDVLTNAFLVGNGNATTIFNNIGYGAGYKYFKNGAEYAESNQAAPMDEFALVELQFQSGIEFEGWQIGRDRTDNSRKWKGWFIEAMAFSRLLTEQETKAVNLYYPLKYAALTAAPLVFPSPDITGSYYSRFDALVPDFGKITDDHEYDDGGRSFNEFADTPPLRWEVDFNKRPESEKLIYDQFYNKVRLAGKFTFTDKYGNVWENVQVEDYNRKHPANRSWQSDCQFKLVKYPNS